MQEPALPASATQESVADSFARQSVLEFRQLLENLPAGAYTCDPNGLITFYNQHAVELWGRSPKINDPVDRYCGSFKLFLADGTPIRHDQCWMALALQTTTGYNGEEIIVQRPNGERLTLLAHANPIRDHSGKVHGAVNVLVDISDRKRNEQALQQADRSKDEFLATLSHELRNPLAPMRNALEIMRLETSLSPESHWALEVLERQTQQMTRLIEDLMDVSRITRNKLELRKERVELAEVLRNAVETSRPQIDAAGHELTVTFPSQPLSIEADPIRLAQVISNLLNNAAKYTERDGHIWLTAERQGSDAVVSVRDDGIGVPVEMLPHIFDMFTQFHRTSDRTVDRMEGGLGIGLTLVKRLVEMHGGSIQAHSDGPGEGCEFNVRLPMVTESLQTIRPTREESKSSFFRILVVDDNRDAARSLGMLLRIRGNDIRMANDGLEAVSVAEEFRPEVILLDIGLPKLNGYEVAQQIRQQPWGTGIVIVAVTGWGQDSDKDRCKNAGFDHHMVKPVDLPELVTLLASLQNAA